jgi:hypothetical protein
MDIMIPEEREVIQLTFSLIANNTLRVSQKLNSSLPILLLLKALPKIDKTYIIIS